MKRKNMILNRIHNLKVEQARRKAVELLALCHHLGLYDIKVEGENYNIKTFLLVLFDKLIGRSRAMGG